MRIIVDFSSRRGDRNIPTNEKDPFPPRTPIAARRSAGDDVDLDEIDPPDAAPGDRSKGRGAARAASSLRAQYERQEPVQPQVSFPPPPLPPPRAVASQASPPNWPRARLLRIGEAVFAS